MTKVEKLDEFLKRIGIELLPFQREILSQMTDGNKIYICYPPNVGRTNTILHLREVKTMPNFIFDPKLDEWHSFCDWIEELPYSELITGGATNE